MELVVVQIYAACWCVKQTHLELVAVALCSVIVSVTLLQVIAAG